MPNRVAFLFPGQGSQAVGMGKELRERFAPARETFAEADEVLGFPLSKLCFEGPLDELTLTANTQPALLATSTALARVLEAELGISPVWATGHSLGEFSALVCAGALSFDDALRLVRHRGRAMQAAVPPGVGSMAALLGLEADLVGRLCAEAAQGQVVSPANLNGAGQVVVAGHREAVERVMMLARENGARRAVALAVSAPFHCTLMQPAADALAEALAQVAVRPPRFPVLSNVTARPYASPDEVRTLLVGQVVSPVRWEECVQQLASLGCTAAVETGPGRVLSGLVKRIAPGIRCVSGEEFDAVRGMAAA